MIIIHAPMNQNNSNSNVVPFMYGYIPGNHEIAGGPTQMQALSVLPQHNDKRKAGT